MSWLTRPEWRLAAKIVLIFVYLLALYLAAAVFQESFSVFDYGRF